MPVKTYAYNDTTQLTAHFNVKEFKCKCGNTHDILISEELVQMLENLRDALDCSKVIINSGYRCTSHAVACELLNKESNYKLNWIDIELMNTENDPYCDVGKSRVEDIAKNKQNSLF